MGIIRIRSIIALAMLLISSFLWDSSKTFAGCAGLKGKTLEQCQQSTSDMIDIAHERRRALEKSNFAVTYGKKTKPLPGQQILQLGFGCNVVGEESSFEYSHVEEKRLIMKGRCECCVEKSTSGKPDRVKLVYHGDFEIFGNEQANYKANPWKGKYYCSHQVGKWFDNDGNPIRYNPTPKRVIDSLKPTKCPKSL